MKGQAEGAALAAPCRGVIGLRLVSWACNKLLRFLGLKNDKTKSRGPKNFNEPNFGFTPQHYL
jgi:hypothetical protein